MYIMIHLCTKVIIMTLLFSLSPIYNIYIYIIPRLFPPSSLPPSLPPSFPPSLPPSLPPPSIYISLPPPLPLPLATTSIGSPHHNIPSQSQTRCPLQDGLCHCKSTSRRNTCLLHMSRCVIHALKHLIAAIHSPLSIKQTCTLFSDTEMHMHTHSYMMYRGGSRNVKGGVKVVFDMRCKVST